MSEGHILQEVMVLGYPNIPGFTRFLAAEKAAISSRITATAGIVASSAFEIFSKGNLFLITARVRGGFSGGPVVNANGMLIGMVSRQPVSDIDGAEIEKYDDLGYGVAIPSEVLQRLRKAIEEGDETVFEELDTSTMEFPEFAE